MYLFVHSAFSAVKITLSGALSTFLQNAYNGHLIQKLRVKCSVTYFFVRALTFSLVSYYMTRSPRFYKTRMAGQNI